MVNMFSKVSSYIRAVDVRYKRILIGVPVSILISTPALAFNVQGICTIAEWYKIIIGAAALVAIFMAVLNSMFSKNALIAEIVEKVLIGCGIAMFAGALVVATGLTNQCGIS